jgi:hypothetical protein
LPGRAELAAAEGRIACIRDVATGQSLLTLVGHEDAVTRVAFGPDGRRLASASRDGTARVWDATTGEAILNLRGHSNQLSEVAFSPDGRRLASVSGGTSEGGAPALAEVKLWDTLTGLEILTLYGTPAQTPRVAFSPDSRRLAVTGDSQVTIWEATQPGEERAAASLVKFLFAKSLPKTAVLDRLCNDATLGDGLRQRAIDLVEPFWQNQVRAEAEKRVESLFRKPLLRSEVLESLRADGSLPEPVRQEALALAERYIEKPFALSAAARAAARRPGAEPAIYRRALRLAETLYRLLPFEGTYQTTLGMVQYRLGQYREALATLTHADELNQAAQGGPVPADLAFLAMTRYQLGDKDQARALLDRLRQTMQEPQWNRNEEACGFLKETETLLRQLK